MGPFRDRLAGGRRRPPLASTPTQARLWTFLRARRLDGFRFRRRHGIGPWIVDFYCPAARLIVELDAAAARERVVAGGGRVAVLAGLGYTVLRIEDASVARDIDGVLGEIRVALRERMPAPRPR